MNNDLLRTVALGKELSDSIRLIRSGLGLLQSLGGGNDFYHLPILTLANGFERLMKTILCFQKLEASGMHPDSNFIATGRNGHDLELLLKRIKEECFLVEYIRTIPVASEDLRFLNSQELAEFVETLSKFGQSARYYNLDVVLGRKPETGDPESEWQQLEINVLLAREDLIRKMKIGDPTGKVSKEIRSLIVAKLERFARALARLMTIGRIGKEAKRHVSLVGTFLLLRDDELGRTRYSPCGQN